MGLEIKNLTKEFHGFKAVNRVSFSFDNNGVYGLLGVNGAGKTTLMRMICTLIHPTSGSITYDGKDIFELDGEYRKMGFPRLLPEKRWIWFCDRLEWKKAKGLK